MCPRLQSPDEDDFPMQLVLGYLGLINGIALSPAIFIMVCNLEFAYCDHQL